MKPILAKHKTFAELSKKFVMVNAEDDDEPKGDQFDVDGKYVPRIFFLGKNTGKTSTSKIYRISSRFFEKEPNGICSHLCKKEPKAGVFCARLARNHTSEEKEKEKKKERGGIREKKRKKWPFCPVKLTGHLSLYRS